MRKTKTTCFLLFLVLNFSLNADNINLSVEGVSVLEDSSNTFLPNGNAVWIGTFDTGFDISSNVFDFTLLSANFGFFDDAGIFQGGTQMLTTETIDFGEGLPGSISDGGFVNDAEGLDPAPAVYLWAFNNSNASLATEYGIFRLSDLGTGIRQNLNFANSFVAAEFGSFNSSTGVATLQAVPEPSTYALFAGILAIGYIAVRRRC